MTRRVPKGVKVGLLAIVLLAGHAATQARTPKSSSQSRKLPQVETPEVPLGPATLPAPCEQARERALALLAELEARLSPQAKTAAERYVATPGPGVSPEKAWGDYAAAALLMGDLPDAAWAGLKAPAVNWYGGN